MTTTTVVPAACRACIRSKLRFWNATSPTARISSTSSTSGSVCTATENASRRNMPDE